MWRAVQTIPRAIRQQWSSSVRSAPQSVHCDQEDPYGLKSASVVHRRYLPTHQNGCLVRWWESQGNDKDGSQEDGTQSHRDWRLPDGSKGALEAVGWGTAILLGLQLSKLYHLNARKDRRRESNYSVPEEVCPLKWIQQVATVSSIKTSSQITDGRRSGKCKSGTICDLTHQSEQNPDLLKNEADTTLEKDDDLDVESLLDAVYDVGILECDTFLYKEYRQEDEFNFKSSPPCGSDSDKEKNGKRTKASKADSDLEAAVRDWVDLTKECTVLTHNRLAWQSIKSGAPVRAFRHWQQACLVGNTEVEPRVEAALMYSTIPVNKVIGQLASAHYNLGLCYETGSGTTASQEKARTHYAIAAADGHSKAMYNLAIFCLEGRGGERNVALAMRLLQKAASLGLEEAHTNLGILLEKGDEEEFRAAGGLLTKAPEVNDVAGKFYLGMCYMNGWGVVKDEEKAAELYSSAAKHNHPEALHHLALFTEKGKGGLTADIHMALDLFRKAAKAGHECSWDHVRRITYILNEKKFIEDVGRFLSDGNTADLNMCRSKSSPALRHASLSHYLRENLHDFGPSVVGLDHSPSSILEVTRSTIISQGLWPGATVKNAGGDTKESQFESEQQSENRDHDERVSFLLGDEEINTENISTSLGTAAPTPTVHLVGGFGDVPIRGKSKCKQKISGHFGNFSVNDRKMDASLEMGFGEESFTEMKLVLCS